MPAEPGARASAGAVDAAPHPAASMSADNATHAMTTEREAHIELAALPGVAPSSATPTSLATDSLLLTAAAPISSTN